MNMNIEVGDTIITCNGRVEATVLEINSWGKATLQYPNSIQSQSVDNLRLIKKKEKKMEEPKLYTIHGGTAHYKKIAQSGGYAWMLEVGAESVYMPPVTVLLSALREVPAYNYLTCQIEGSSVSIYKRALKNSGVHVGMSFVTENGSVLTIKEVSGQVPPHTEEKLMNPVKIPMLEGRRIQFM